MDNYKKINKQLIEQNSEMRVRLGQERENSSFLCRQLMEERTIRVELQRRLVQMHTKLFADAMRCLCPMENAVDVLSDQLAERSLSEGDSQQRRSTATLGRPGSNASVRSSMERRRASGGSGRSSLERPSSTGSQRRSSLERFTSNIDLPTSPPRRRQSFGQCSIVAAERATDNDSEQESQVETPQQSPRVCSFLEEDEEEYNEQEQSLLEEAEEDHSATLEEETEADDSEVDEEGSPRGDPEVEDEEEDSPRDETDRDEPHSSRDETERDPSRDEHVAAEVQQQARKKTCSRYPKVRVEKHNLLADVTNRCFVTQRNNYSNESLPQERMACSPSTLLRAKPPAGSPKHSENCSIGSPRRLTSDSYNITMQNLLSSTPNSSRMSPASLCGHLEWQQQPSTILATTDTCCDTSTLRPRRGCVPKSYIEPSLRAKLRNETTKDACKKKSNQRSKKTKSN